MMNYSVTLLDQKGNSMKHGINGSVCSGDDFSLASLLPSQRYQGLKGIKVSAHNNSELIGPRLTLGPLDVPFLLLEKGTKSP